MRVYVTLLLGMLGFCMSIAHAGSPEPVGIASWGHPIPSAELDTHRGGTDPGTFTFNTNQLNAKLFNNSATNNFTGNNSITGGAFAGASGLPTVIQNSGNNVIIQNGTVLNLTLK